MREARLGLLALVIPLVCCGGPLLVAVVVATGVGAWLAANRLILGLAGALVVATVALGFWIQQRRRCSLVGRQELRRPHPSNRCE